jgi:DNA-directed RNA polymerase specialized sigma24 family protein
MTGLSRAVHGALEGRMLRTVRRVVRDPDLAQDAVQDAVVRLWQHRTRSVAIQPREALVLRVCLHAAIDAVRRAERGGGDGRCGSGDRPGAAGRGPCEALEQREQYEVVVRAIAPSSCASRRWRS